MTLDGVFVDQAGEWKLGGLEHCCSAKDPDAMALVRSKVSPDQVRYLPPEVQRNGLDPRLPPSAADMFSLAMVIYEVCWVRGRDEDVEG